MKQKRKPTRVHTRKLDRGVARHNLEKQGNLHNAIKSKHFALNWRKYTDATKV